MAIPAAVSDKKVEGPDGDFLGVLGHAVRAAARLPRQLGRRRGALKFCRCTVMTATAAARF
jgi:hypothetical protein